MSMSYWMIASWVLVAVLTAVNVFVFLKLKRASEQMMRTAFPGAGNMGEAMAQMQKMMGLAQRGRGNPMAGGAGGMNPQMKAAMQMLQQLQKKK